MPAYIGRYDWDLAQQAIAVTGSAEDPDYPATNLVTEDAAVPGKLTATAGSFVLEMPAPIAPAFAMLPYHYLDAGLSNVKIQANSSNSWGAPAFEQTFTIPSKRRDGPAYQRWTKSPMIELEGLDPGGYEWWRLLIGTANSQNVVIGRLALYSQLLQVQLLHVDGSPFDQRDATTQIANMTDLDVESGIYMLGGPRRTLSAYVIGTDLDAGTAPIQEASDFQGLHEVTEGRVHPFAFAPFGNFDDVWLVRPEAVDMPRAHRQGGYQVFPLAVREIARGLPWP
jgi:hypothetical protein